MIQNKNKFNMMKKEIIGKNGLRLGLKILLGIVFVFAVGVGNAQTQRVFDINNLETQNTIQTGQSDESVAVEAFREVERYRKFDYNKQLVSLRAENIGDTLLLNFFEDRQYKAVIQSIVVNDLGKIVITAQIAGNDFAYCFLIVSERGIAISADLPQEDERFFAVEKNGQIYLGQIKKSVLDKDRLEGSEPVVEPEPEQPVREEEILEDDAKDEGYLNDPPLNDPASPATIDLMFVYTDSAASWAAKSSTVTDIDNVIDIAVAEANTAMTNSGTGITFRVAYRHLTNYTELDNSNDFYRFRDKEDGYMDEVHGLRDAFCADVMVFLAKISYTGGTGGLLNNINGFSNDAHASCICRVQQSATGSFTVVHEIGHNMGCAHHASQGTQPGPNTSLPAPLNKCSAGWKGTISSKKSCSIMTYESASEYGESGNYNRIPYFSSPDITVSGVVIGDAATMDNARVLRETKTVTEAYRTMPTTPTLNVSQNIVSFSEISAVTTQAIFVAGLNITGNITYTIDGTDKNMFSVTPVSWNPAKGGILEVTFNGVPTQDYEAYITFSAAGASNKIVNLRYVTCTTFSVEESFEQIIFPPDCWRSEAPTNAKWKRIEGTGYQPDANPHSGTGMLEFNTYNSGSAPAGSKGLLISPKIFAGNTNCSLSFWMYRDNYNSSYDHRVNVYVNSTPSISGATLLTTIYGCRQKAPTASPNTWNQYTYTLPTSSMVEAYVIFEGVKGSDGYGYINMYIDDIEIEGETAPTVVVDSTSLIFKDIASGKISDPKIINVSGVNLIGNITYNKTGADASAFTITETSWNAASGGTLSITFTPDTNKTYSASIVFGSASAKSRTLTLSGTRLIPVTNIINVPNSATSGIAIMLTKKIVPSDASYQTVVWKVKNAGTTKASVSGSTFYATEDGTAIVTATIANGSDTGDYVQDFTITVTGTGVKELQGGEVAKLQVYPNPAKNELKITN